jgi:hypothetical protein
MRRQQHTPSDALPTIVTAAFSGASATPAAGDTLLLFFSEQVTLSPGALLTNADVSCREVRRWATSRRRRSC